METKMMDLLNSYLREEVVFKDFRDKLYEVHENFVPSKSILPLYSDIIIMVDDVDASATDGRQISYGSITYDDRKLKVRVERLLRKMRKLKKTP